MQTPTNIPALVVAAAIVDDLSRPTTLLSGRRTGAAGRKGRAGGTATGCAAARDPRGARGRDRARRPRARPRGRSLAAGRAIRHAGVAGPDHCWRAAPTGGPRPAEGAHQVRAPRRALASGRRRDHRGVGCTDQLNGPRPSWTARALDRAWS